MISAFPIFLCSGEIVSDRGEIGLHCCQPGEVMQMRASRTRGNKLYFLLSNPVVSHLGWWWTRSVPSRTLIPFDKGYSWNQGVALTYFGLKPWTRVFRVPSGQ